MTELIPGTSPAALDKDWDPPAGKRTYYRHATTGDSGWMVRRGGREMVRLDRPNQEILKHFVAHEWIPDKEHRPLNRIQVAQVCFAADQRLCFALGLHAQAKVEWVDLTQEKKKHWMHEGPSMPAIRGVVFARIRDALESLTT